MCVAIGVLPMPDGSYRTFRTRGGKAGVEEILAVWMSECEEMEDDEEV